MLTYNMDKRKGTPMYDYLYQCVRDDILAGRLIAGEKLPSKRSLANHLNISIITVENAYAQLQLEGYIMSEEKKGYFVCDLDHFTRNSCVLRPRIEEEFEYSFFADLRSNRIRRKQFPFSIWTKLIRDTISKEAEQLLKTVPYNGVYELRQAIADYLQEFRGMQVMPSQIVIGSGTETLYSHLIPLLGEKTVWAVEKLGNQKITGVYDMYHANYKAVEVDEDGVDIGSLIDNGCNVVHVSPTNNFPIGTVMPVKRRQELLNWAQAQGRYIIEDDYDSEFRYQGKLIAPIYSMDTQGKVIYMNNFSKTLIPSLRISYMVLPFELVKLYRENLSFYSGTVPSMEQYALARFISEGYFTRHINHMKIFYKGQRNKFISAIRNSELGKISEIKENNAGTHFLLEVTTKYTDKELVMRARKQDIDVACLSEYQKGTIDSHTIVINYAGIHEERIEETVRRLFWVVAGTKEGFEDDN